MAKKKEAEVEKMIEEYELRIADENYRAKVAD